MSETTGEYCKSRGVRLVDIENATQQNRQTLNNWHKNKRDLFDVLIDGVLARRLKESAHKLLDKIEAEGE